MNIAATGLNIVPAQLAGSATPVVAFDTVLAHAIPTDDDTAPTTQTPIAGQPASPMNEPEIAVDDASLPTLIANKAIVSFERPGIQPADLNSSAVKASPSSPAILPEANAEEEAIAQQENIPVEPPSLGPRANFEPTLRFADYPFKCQVSHRATEAQPHLTVSLQYVAADKKSPTRSVDTVADDMPALASTSNPEQSVDVPISARPDLVLIAPPKTPVEKFHAVAGEAATTPAPEQQTDLPPTIAASIIAEPQIARLSSSFGVANVPTRTAQELAMFDNLAREIIASSPDIDWLRFSVTHETLGALKVDIQSVESGFDIQLQPDNDSAASRLSAEAPRLIEELRQSGVKLANSDLIGGHSSDSRREQSQPNYRPQQHALPAFRPQMSAVNLPEPQRTERFA